MAFGLKPVRYLSGAPYNGAVNKYYVEAGYGTALRIGDPVALGGTGDAAGNYPNVVLATLAAANAMCGVIVGIEPDADDLSLTYIPASTGGYVYVADDPNLVFEAEEDAVGAALAIADIGNLGILVTGTASAIYGTSGIALDSSSFASNTANGQFRLVGLVNSPDNALSDTSPNAKFLVAWNKAQHSFG